VVIERLTPGQGFNHPLLTGETMKERIMGDDMYGIIHCAHEYLYMCIRSGVAHAVCQNLECRKDWLLCELPDTKS